MKETNSCFLRIAGFNKIYTHTLNGLKFQVSKYHLRWNAENMTSSNMKKNIYIYAITLFTVEVKPQKIEINSAYFSLLNSSKTHHSNTQMIKIVNLKN